MTCRTAIGAFVCLPFVAFAQGDKDLREKADALFAQGEYAQAMPMYSQLVSLEPGDHELSYRYGTCSLFGGEDKDKAIGFLKFATQGATPPPLAWYFLGKAYHLTYHFDQALEAYEHYRGTGDKKTLADHPIDALEQQCRNGKNLLSNLKEIEVHNKVEVDGSEFFRFYDLSDIGGKIVVTPDELKSSLDKKSKERSLVYLPAKGGSIYFSSLGKDGRTGRDIYRTQLLPTGEFATPVKLAGYINTDQDEDFACMGPDGKTFYFCSKGHNSMGGYDVFKSSYDPAGDVFGAPENMDFAVNTPDDDVLYIVDPEGKEACFASGRDSKQGMLHVYRVGTSQAPVNITVLKGTFASQFDAKDRKAHITVEDALTRAVVADVRTDINGEYVLALPRSGKYKFMVEAGPSGRTHMGVVELPRSEESHAYRQEMSLVDQGGEKLMIKNYFEEPLQEDVMALAMDEIKRRAKLDVTGALPVAQAPEEKPVGDLMTQAGFTGDVSLMDAVKLSQDDAAAQAKKADELEQRSKAAYTIAAANAEVAEAAAKNAKDLVQQAEALADEGEKNVKMMAAARERQRSREANTRARTAYRTAQDLDADRTATQQRAAHSAEVSTTLAKSISERNNDASLTALKDLKARIDAQNGPQAEVDAAERMRRAATEAEKVAAKKLQEANGRRDDESELADRIGRMKREQADAKGKKKDDLAHEIAALEEQQGALREEVGAAFAKAKLATKDASIARGQAGLATRLATQDGSAPVTDLDKDQIAALGTRIGATESRLATTSVDERYDAAVAEAAEVEERRTFDWDAANTTSDAVAESSPTQVAARDTTNVAQRASTNAATMQADPTADMHPVSAAPKEAPGVGLGEQPDVATNAPTNAAPPLERTGTRVTDDVAAAPSTSTKPIDPAQHVPENGALATDNGRTASSGANKPLIVPMLADTSRSSTASVRTHAANDSDLASVRGIGERPEMVPEEVDTTASASDRAEEESFVLANQLAELKQLRLAEKRKAQQDSLDLRIADVQQRMRTAQEPPSVVDASEAGAPEAMEPEQKVTGTAKSFDASINEAALVEQLYPDFAKDKEQIASGITDPRERAQDLHALELMLVDSIDDETARQVATLDTDPSSAPAVLARVERLRVLKAVHVQEAGQALLAVDQHYAASETDAMESGALATTRTTPKQATSGPSSTPHNDGYVAVAHDPERVYESLVEHRSKNVAEAVQMKDQDLERMGTMEESIDSAESVLENMPRGKGYDKLRDQTDRLIDDHMILRSQLGERMEHISKEEFAAAQDSAKVLRASVDRKGFAQDEPLLLMAKEFEDEAGLDMKNAGAMRKQAERANDILARDSLYRQAYATELGALREMDRSHTVRNWMLGDDFARGTAMSYEDIEERMFHVNATPLAWNAGKEEVATAPVTVAPASAQAPIAVPVPAPKPPADAREAAQRMEELERASVAAADKANAAQDSSLSASKEQRERLTARSGALRSSSDSLHLASVEMGELAKHLEQNERDAADRETLKQHLHNYYYLSSEEQGMVLNEEDRSHYFQAKVKAMDQRAEAGAAISDAEGSTKLATDLDAQARDLRSSGTNADQTALLEARAAQLNERADSLRKVAEGLNKAAMVNDVQAGTLLQGLPAERSTSIMAMEQRARRAEAPVPTAVQPAPKPAPATAEEKPAPAPVPATAPVPVPVPATATAPVPAPVPVPATANAPGPSTSTTSLADAPLKEDVFEVGGTSARNTPIAIDAPMPKGVVFKVQIGAFKQGISKEAFSDMTPVAGESAGNGFVRYTAGMFTSVENAAKASQKVRDRGYRDAFVVAYEDGHRISLKEAIAKSNPAPASPAPVAATHAPVDIAAPPAVTPAIAATDDAVLASYPASATDLLQQFKPSSDVAAYYNDPKAAPARQVETVKGLFFTVQVGVYSKPTALDKLFNITPLNSERTETGKIRYTTGVFLDMDPARIRKDGTVALGVKDAFITAYLNGKRIPMRDARALVQKFGKAVMADPAISTR